MIAQGALYRGLPAAYFRERSSFAIEKVKVANV